MSTHPSLFPSRATRADKRGRPPRTKTPAADFTARRPVRIARSTDGFCATSKDCFIQASSKAARQRWCDEHDLFLSDDGRVFALVDTALEVYFMDAITGTLYSLGQCHSSDILKRDHFTRDREKATDILMSIKKDGSRYGYGYGRDAELV